VSHHVEVDLNEVARLRESLRPAEVVPVPGVTDKPVNVTDPSKDKLPVDVTQWSGPVSDMYSELGGALFPEWDSSPRGQALLEKGTSEILAGWFPNVDLENVCSPWLKMLAGAGFLIRANFSRFLGLFAKPGPEDLTGQDADQANDQDQDQGQAPSAAPSGGFTTMGESSNAE